MTSYRETLLNQPGPLDAHEVHDLERWLGALREDVDTFGPTPEDESRTAAIEGRIERERQSVPGGRP